MVGLAGCGFDRLLMGPGLESLPLVFGLPIPYVHALVARLCLAGQRLDVPPDGTLHSGGKAGLLSRLVSCQRSILVVLRISQPLRAELVLRRSAGLDPLGICSARHDSVFDGAPRCVEHDGTVGIGAPPQSRAGPTPIGALAQANRDWLRPLDDRGRRTGGRRPRAGQIVSARLGGAAAPDHRYSDDYWGRDDFLQARTWRRQVLVARSHRGTDLRTLLGNVELQEPGPLGVCHSFRAPLQAVRDAAAGLRRLFA